MDDFSVEGCSSRAWILDDMPPANGQTVDPNIVIPSCHKEMVFQSPKGAVHSDEPAFCIGKTEEPQAEFMAFLSRTDPSAYLEVSRLLDQGPPVKGDRKPAVYVKWGEARGYCEFKYGKGADLPTEMQWENACGSGTYCTASGNLNPTEAIYDADGPADVGSTLPNPQRVQDMTGNVWEWVLGGVDDVYKRIRGGSWATYHGYDWYLLADYRHNLISDFRGSYVGFRCVAPAMSAVEGPPLPATTPSTDEDSKK